MIKELWHSFPRMLEEKINALLDEAEPSPAKVFQLYKSFQRESLWQGTYEQFAQNVEDFFALPKSDRSKSRFDTYLDRPMPSFLFEDFHLDFRSGLVSGRSVLDIASWAHHLIRVSLKTECVIISADVLTKTLQYITHPPLFEKALNIEFEDFCAAWKKTAFKLFGKKYDSDLEKILAELRWLHKQTQLEEKKARDGRFIPTIYLTQTEIDWIESVQKSAQDIGPIPAFPLSRGPEKQRLIDLNRTISLYRIVQTTRLPELLVHRDNIRATLLDQCQRLLKERAR